jgi:pimeloyl-ACP methyl ester carboxylesterase
MSSHRICGVFGGTSAPADIDAYSIFDTVGDMVALVTALGEKQAVIVGHDWGAPVAWHAALFRPDFSLRLRV